MSFGQKIKDLRTERDMTLDELSKLTGLSKGYLSKLENGHRKTPKAETINKLAKGLRVEYEDLMFSAGYISKHEFEKLNKLIKDTPDMYNFNSIISAAYMNIDFFYDGEKLSREEKTFIAETLRIILNNDIPISQEDREKALNLLETFLK